jgi:hypothetical protein
MTNEQIIAVRQLQNLRQQALDAVKTNSLEDYKKVVDALASIIKPVPFSIMEDGKELVLNVIDSEYRVIENFFGLGHPLDAYQIMKNITMAQIALCGHDATPEEIIEGG